MYGQLWLKKIKPREKTHGLWAVMDSNHRSRKTAELQSAPFGHSGNCPKSLLTATLCVLFCRCSFVERRGRRLSTLLLHGFGLFGYLGGRCHGATIVHACCKNATYNDESNQCPSGFFEKIGRFANTHNLVRTRERRCQTTTFGVLHQNYQHQDDRCCYCKDC